MRSATSLPGPAPHRRSLKHSGAGSATAVVPGLAVMDESGGTAIITTAYVNQSNGVIHVVDAVLLPQ